MVIEDYVSSKWVKLFSIILIKLGALALGGTITQNGGLLPITTPAYENGVLWARARDTGALHRLKLVNWRTGAGGSYPTYMRSADADQYTTLLIPGTYDLLWERAYGDASPEPYVDAQARSPYADTPSDAKGGGACAARRSRRSIKKWAGIQRYRPSSKSLGRIAR